MNLSEYKDYLTGAIAVEANFTSDETARRAFETLVEHLREMDLNEQYMQDAWRGHGELPDDAQRKDALRTALAEYRSYDKAEQLQPGHSTYFETPERFNATIAPFLAWWASCIWSAPASRADQRSIFSPS